MRGLPVLFLLACLFNINFHLVSAIRCYSCTVARDHNLDCEVNVEKAKSLECPPWDKYCFTSINNIGFITRDCGDKNSCDILVALGPCTVCETDLCNTNSGAFVPGYSTALVVCLWLFALIKVLA